MNKRWFGCLMLCCLLAVAMPMLGEMTQGQALREELPYQMGDQSEVIRDIREALFQIRGLYIEQQRPGEGDGELWSAQYDEALAREVCKYQRMQGLPETGEIDAATMDLLLPRYYARIDAAARGALVLGTMSGAVRTMQENLRKLGFYSGDITGHVGQLTEGAVMAFQQAHGLEANGFADETTLAAIAEAMTNRK